MESVLMGHPERVMPFCVRDVTVTQPARMAVAVGGGNEAGLTPGASADGEDAEQVLFQITGNHHSRQVIRLNEAVITDCLTLRLLAPAAHVPAALLEVRCYPTP
jgi:hypothetical protein